MIFNNAYLVIFLSNKLLKVDCVLLFLGKNLHIILRAFLPGATKVSKLTFCGSNCHIGFKKFIIDLSYFYLNGGCL
jgi:hypothetical protein